MTKEEIDFLAKIDIDTIGGNLHPNTFFVPYIGDVVISKLSDFSTILHRIYNKGYEEGVRHGKNIKINEIKDVLNLT